MSAPTLIERADALRAEGKPLEALRLIQEAMRANPLDFSLWRQAGRAAFEGKEYRAAAGFLEFYVRSSPGDYKAWFHLATANFTVGEYAAAARAYQQGLAIRPDALAALIPFGFCLYILGKPDAGYAVHSHAMSLPPDNPSNATGVALIRITRGEWRRGWDEFEARWEIEGTYPQPEWRGLTTQLWNGETTDRTLWLHPEGGLGDAVLFSRYAALAATRSRRVVLSTIRPLDRLLLTVPGVDAIMPPEADIRSAEFVHASMWSMPHLFPEAPLGLPSSVPYMSAPSTGPRLLAAAPGTRLRVGLVWSGNPKADHDVDRSVPTPEVLAPLFEVSGVEWVALQQGPRAEWAAQLPVVPAPAVTDFADTAFVMAQLDLLVSVDTSSANLAGALGLEAWVMVPTIPEFRWPIDHTEDTPWYPSVRVFRRRHGGDWDGVIRRIAHALRERVAGREPGRTVSAPEQDA